MKHPSQIFGIVSNGKREVPVRHPLQYTFFFDFFMRNTGHIHGFLWLKDALPIDELDWDNSNDLQRIVDYFSSIITAYNPDPFRPRGREDCLLKDILSPHALSSWQLEDDHCALCNRCQKHGSLRHGV